MRGEPAVRLKTQQVLTLLALAAIAAVGWYFLVATESAMRVMHGDGFFMELMGMMMRPGSAAPYLGATALMWIVMMIAMMVPAVMPMLLVFRKLDRGKGAPFDTVLFAGGYLLAWFSFSLGAAVLQWVLHNAGWLGGDLLSVRPLLAAGVLVAAGLYQLTPIKEACLDKCRSPMGFFLANWRDGRWGAVRMGLQHGFFCIGCCWMLMLIMFVGGAMSVMTMALLSVFILAERILPAGPWVARLPGVGLIAWGGYLAILA
jgi:predicted metal-binding membrane protein